jgi:inositol transport system permease protein
MANTTAVATAAPGPATRRWALPMEASILLVLVGIALLFEVLGWALRGQSFLLNPQRLMIIILQVSIIGLLAIGVTQVIITGGIDLSLGSVVALAAMVAASLAQQSGYARAVYPALGDLPAFVPVFAGLAVGALAGLVNGSLTAYGGIPPFIATLGMMVTARGLARWYTEGQPISMLTPQYTFIGQGTMPILIFVLTAIVFHIALTYTRYGKYTYAIGGNMQAARVSGINVQRHLVIVYAIAGLLAGLGGIITSARAASGQAAMGVGYELDAIAAAVIGGTSLSGGIGRISGTVIGTLILGIMISGFTFLGVDAYIQDIVKGVIIVVAVLADQYRRRRRA